MTTKVMEKAASEYADFTKTACLADGIEFTSDDYVFTKADFRNGVEFADKLWQEKTRWVPIEEKIPPRQSRTRQIFCKNKYIVSVVFISCGDKGYLNSIESLNREFTHWKEIE